MPLFNQAPQSLCILRLSAIGDVCHAVAVVQQVQAYWSKTKITWVIGKTEYQLLQGLPGIDFIVFDKKQGWKGILALWKQIRRHRFDALLNMQTALRASILSLGIKANYKIGFGKIRSREMQHCFVNQRIQDPTSPHVLDGFLAFAQYLGVPTKSPTWSMPITEEDYQSAMQFIDATKKNAIISPCSSKAEKDWLPERYAEIANYLHQQNVNVLLCCSPAQREIEMSEKITALCDFFPTNLAGKTDLKTLTALIDLADLVIAPDSGPAHIATTQNTPVIGLYAYHNPLRTGPYYNLANVVSVYEKNVQKEYHHPSAQLPWATKLKSKNLMAEITTAQVIQQIRQFI